MTGAQRREQLLDVGLALFSEKGFDRTSVEELAARAEVSKPVVYVHFGGKDGLYAVVVDREVQLLLERVEAALALLTYVEDRTDGFRILVHESSVARGTGSFATIMSDVAVQVQGILDREFRARGYETALSGLYAQALVGMVALTGQWWLEERSPSRDDVAAHLVNLAWNGLSHLQTTPTLEQP